MKLLCILFLFPMLNGCGQDSYRVVKKPYKDPPPAVAVSWDDIKPLVDDKCNKCHGKSVGSTFTKANFGEKAQARIGNGSMPPGGGLDADTKAKLLAY